MSSLPRYWTLCLLALLPFLAHAESASRTPAGAAVATAEALDQALAGGDPAKVRALLLPELLVFESGAVESSLEEYSAQHLPADLEFMRGVQRKITNRRSGGDGRSAWVTTRARLTGSYKGKPVDLDSNETLILKRTPAGWRIAHIHWSSMDAAR